MHHTKTLYAVLVTALALTSAGLPAATEAVTLSWDMNPEPEVVGYVVHIGNEPGVYTHRVDVGNTTAYVLTTATAGQRYCFAVSAYFAGPVEGSRSSEVCTDSNQPPTLASPGAQNHPLGQALSVALTATDPEGATLTFSATGLPPGLAIASATGMVSGAPSQAGSFSVRATVSDGLFSASQSFTWTIASNPPPAPTLLRPTGSITTVTPTFEWQAVATATRYRLWVDDAGSVNPRVQVDLTPSEAGCAAGGAVCRSTPAVTLVAGAASWSVRASNAVGDGPWSGAMDFSVPDGRPPVVAIASPTASATFSTSAGTLALAGTASDDVAVAQITWVNDRGGAGTASGTTSWSVSSIPLLAGANVITVTARDGRNNVSTDVLTVTRSDGQAPVVEISLPTAASAHSTSNPALALGGVARDEYGVSEVRWVNSRGGAGMANGTTSWGVPAVTLSPGSNLITVTARDAAGQSGSAQIAVTLTDGTAPAVTIVSPTSGSSHSTTTGTIAIAGTASDAFGVTQVTWANSRGGSGTASGTSGWTIGSVALQPGDNVVTVTARDAAGLTGTATLTVAQTDGAAPTVNITTPTTSSSHSTGQAAISLAGTAQDAFGVASVSWTSDRGGSGAASGTTAWSVPTAALQPGVNTFTITARDAAGRTGTDVIAVTRTDGEPPAVAIAAPTAAATHATGTATLNLAGTASDPFGIAQVAWANNRGGGGNASGTTAWSAAGIALRPGENVITVTARDNSGSTATDVLTVTLTDQENPTITISSPTDSTSYSTSNAAIALGGVASDAFGVIDVRWSTDKGASGSATGTTSWTAPSVTLSPGANVITVTARDAAGRTAADTLTVTRTDNEPPAVSIASPTTNPTHATNSRTLSLAGTATDSFGVAQVSWANDRGGSGAAAGTTAWTVPAVTLQPGVNVITVTARDAAGNTARDVLAVTMSDGDAPTIRIVTPTQAASFPTTSPTIAVGGSAADEVGVARVTWTNSQGGSGVANGTTEWSIPALALRPGMNVVTVTAADAAGNTSRATLSVTTTDGQRPVITIVSPTADPRFVTTLGGVDVSGTARDDFGVASITWTSNRGGAGAASGTTAWSIPNLTLQAGLNEITVTATDVAGNVATDVLTVRADSRRPTVSIQQPVSTATYAANVATLDLAGVAADDQGVSEVGWANDRGGRGVATGTDAWRAVSIPLSPGINAITVTARDEAGNSSAAVLTVVKDTAAPRITIEAPTNAPTLAVNTNAVSLRGAANDDLGVTQVTWTNDRGGSGAAQGATAWTVAAIPLLAGSNVITVTARDAAGNSSADTLTVVLDTRAPVVSIASPTASGLFSTTSTSMALAGAVDDQSPIAEVGWTNSRGGSGVASGSSRWSIDRVGLRAGVNDLTITARDAAGNTASARLRVTATDSQAPTITIHGPSPADAFSTSQGVVNLNGVAADDFEVAQVAWASDRGVSGVARGTTRWIAGGIALQPGVNVIAVTAVDGAGRTATDVLRITVDSQLPAVSITAPATNGVHTSNSSTVVLTGAAADDAGITQVMWLSDRGPSGMATGTTAWTTPPVRLEPGPNVFTVTARDGSGNDATATLTVVYADSIAPTLSIASRLPAGVPLVTQAATMTLSGTAQDGVGVVQVAWSASSGGAGTAVGTTAWTAANIPLAVGSNLITVTARDAAGNLTTATASVKRQAPLETAATPTNTTGRAATTAASAAPPAGSSVPSPVPTAAESPSELQAAPNSSSMPFQMPVMPPTGGQAATTSAVRAPERTQGGPESSNHPVTTSTADVTESLPNDEPPATPPVVAVSAPTAERHVTMNDTLTVSGTASHSSGITQVTWITDQGKSGIATGREEWTISGLPVSIGTTVLTITAQNSLGDLASDVLTIVRQSPVATGLTIVAPTTGPSWTTAARTVAFRGVASDNVVRVTWTADWGGSGTASGTKQWTIPTIGLQIGANRITVRAEDRTGGSTERVVTVNYSPRKASGR